MGSGWEIKDEEAILRINPSVYPLERVYATAYIFLDKYYFLLDGDKEKEIIVNVKPKEPKTAKELERFANRFFEEMLSITNYFNQLERNREMINLILQRALFSVTPKPLSLEEKEALERIDEEIKAR